MLHIQPTNLKKMVVLSEKKSGHSLVNTKTAGTGLLRPRNCGEAQRQELNMQVLLWPHGSGDAYKISGY